MILIQVLMSNIIILSDYYFLIHKFPNFAHLICQNVNSKRAKLKNQQNGLRFFFLTPTGVTFLIALPSLPAKLTFQAHNSCRAGMDDLWAEIEAHMSQIGKGRLKSSIKLSIRLKRKTCRLGGGLEGERNATMATICFPSIPSSPFSSYQSTPPPSLKRFPTTVK